MDPTYGVIGFQQGPPWRVGPQCSRGMIGSRDWDAGCGDDRQAPARVFRSEEGDQGDLPGAEGLSRKVVRKVVRSGATEFVYERKVQPQPKIGPWREDLDRLWR